MSRKPLQHSQSLAMAIEEQRAKTDTRQILTRSQAKLADELKNLAALESEKAGISTDLASTRANLLDGTRITRIRTVPKATAPSPSCWISSPSATS